MIPLGLSATEQQALTATLLDSHSINVIIQVLNLAGDRLGDVSNVLIDGQVNIDTSSDVSRSCTLSLLDPNRNISFDSNSPGDGALFVDRMIRVLYCVQVPSQGWVEIPVFTGPITKVDRSDDVVNVEAQGKESLATGAAWVSRTWKKGARKTDVIQDILSERAGETLFDFPALPNDRLPKDFSLGPTSVPWAAAAKLAAGIDYQLFYDGKGTARLRRPPTNPVFTFATGDGGSVMSVPQITFEVDDLKNVVWVKGGTPKGAKKSISVHVTAPRSHPMSPWSLGRNGVPRYLLDVIDDGNILSESKARDVAQSTLNRALLQTVNVAFDTLPIPHLEPLDFVQVTTDDFSQAFSLTQMSLPLVTGNTMSIGYLKRVSVKARRSRHR